MARRRRSTKRKTTKRGSSKKPFTKSEYAKLKKLLSKAGKAIVTKARKNRYGDTITSGRSRKAFGPELPKFIQDAGAAVAAALPGSK